MVYREPVVRFYGNVQAIRRVVAPELITIRRGDCHVQGTVDELPKNYISFRVIGWNGDNNNRVNVTPTKEKYDLGTMSGTNMGGVTLTLSGGGSPSNNLMPAKAVFAWLRTA